ncbi:hypothetical protein ASE01_18295 [Nocardioides sp. Root190]|uniref:FAD:protein FMN transferase n=1 Tax=Nocardioides sp. Root190 TaxID=1736488 RepID=UPI0006F915A2|nr:FAD:protein FMN transferase [Nocardioides sp. Root190]KRB73953.1 hypothetical protein ASE01_18295 [Nocardioides sp. Root190]
MTAPTRPHQVANFTSLGTSWEIAGDHGLDLTPALAVLDDLDRTWSRFREDSSVSRAARHGGSIPLTPTTTRLLDLHDLLDDLTTGAVNPLVGGSLEALGYDASYSLVAGSPVPAPPWRSLPRSEDHLVVPAGVVVDIGAAGKGLAVDLVVAAMEDSGQPVRWVDASGDLCHVSGEGPLRVALEHPSDPSSAIGVWDLAPGSAMGASATNRRAWGEGLHHVLDARTGRPVRRVVATWAVAGTAMLADAAATALFFLSSAAVEDALGVAAVRMFTDHTVDCGRGFTGEIFT